MLIQTPSFPQPMIFHPFCTINFADPADKARQDKMDTLSSPGFLSSGTGSHSIVKIHAKKGVSKKTPPLTTARRPVPPAILAPLLIFAPVTGSIQRVDGRLAPVDRPELVQGRKESAPVPGLDGMVPRDPVRDILHMAAHHLFSRHLLKAERDARDPEPVSPRRCQRASHQPPA